MNYDAYYFADLLVKAAKKESSRRSYKHGISVGEGHIPYDTGRTQNSVFISKAGEKTAQVRFNGSETPYAVYLQYAHFIGNTNRINMHQGFLQKFAKDEFITELRRHFRKVEIQ